MFLHVNRAPKPTGGYYEYLRILETFYENGVHKQRVVATLGRLDKIRGRLGKLARALSEFSDERLVRVQDVMAVEALPWGPVLLARHLYEGLKLGEIIRKHCGSSRQGFDVAERAFVLIANRLCDPRSEHGLARWLENTYVCDGGARRWRADWLPAREITKARRVRVKSRQLQKWYRTLDALLRGKEGIERALYYRVRDLFSLKVDMVFYDVTSTYFARRSAKEVLRRHGHSRDGRPRNVQVVLGVVMANGFPIAHHVFPGNTADKKTFQEAVADVERRFGLRRVLVVCDRGMVSEENMEFLRAGGREVRYLLGLPGRGSEEARRVFEGLNEDRWIRVDGGNRVQEIRCSEVSYIVVESDERKAYEEALRKRSMERVRERLEKIKESVDKGRLRDRVKIGTRVGSVMKADHGRRYYSYEIGEDGFRFWEDEEKLKEESLHEGRYILKTDDRNLSAEDGVEIYKELSDVEGAYRELKDVIEMRPIYHRTDDRVEAHIFIATLALFLKRTLRQRLREKAVVLSATEAFEAMRSVGAAVLDVGGEERVVVGRGGRDARLVMRALGIKEELPGGG